MYVFPTNPCQFIPRSYWYYKGKYFRITIMSKIKNFSECKKTNRLDVWNELVYNHYGYLMPHLSFSAAKYYFPFNIAFPF